MVDYVAEHSASRLRRDRNDFRFAMGRPCGSSSPFPRSFVRVPLGLPQPKADNGLDHRSAGTRRPCGSEENLAGSTARCCQLPDLGGWIFFQQGVVARNRISRRGKLPCPPSEPAEFLERNSGRGFASPSCPNLRQKIGESPEGTVQLQGSSRVQK